MNYFFEIQIPFLASQSREEVFKHLENFVYDGANEGEIIPGADKESFEIIEGVECFQTLDEKIKDKVEYVAVFFFEDSFEEKFNEANKYLNDNSIQFRATKKPTEDWNTEWKKYYKPIELIDAHRVIPSHLINQESGLLENEIGILPGQGFGTGEHSTTFLCLNAYLQRKEELRAKSCLDFGCGSGILGIAAMKWGAMHVDFMDLDPRALDNCVQNIVLNFDEQSKGKDLSNTKIVSRDRFVLSHQYELVFANILEHVLIEESEDIKECVQTNGFLILSGILIEQAANIISHYESLGFKFIKKESDGDWSAVVVQKI